MLLIITMNRIVNTAMDIESEVVGLDFPPSFTAIPALQPIVHDLFVLRGSNKADAGKELDTQKEVVVSMLLRLVQHHQVLSPMDPDRHGALTSQSIKERFSHPDSCFSM